MESEKAIYWTTLGVLALAAVTGFATGHQGWGDRLADRSIAIVAQASGMAKNYAEIADMVLERDEADSEHPTQALIDIQDAVQNRVQPQLACAERILVKRQAQLARLQAVKVRVRMVERAPRTIVLPGSNFVIQVPQLPEIPQQDTLY